MKKLVKYLLVLLFFASCTPQKYYQLVETDSNDLVKTRDSQTFENNDIIVSYNLWSNKGN
ncbi:MAG: hypothetical protein C0596_03175 [Marinilabiliales bacterium]|nr:MAG: hypothetical protein C0596_03175 [Marinilabiliales bacterium]